MRVGFFNKNLGVGFDIGPQPYYNNFVNYRADVITKTDEPYKIGAGCCFLIGFFSLVGTAIITGVVANPLIPAVCVGCFAAVCLIVGSIFSFIAEKKRNEEITNRYNEDMKLNQNILKKVYGLDENKNEIQKPDINQQNNINNEKNENKNNNINYNLDNGNKNIIQNV